MAAVGGHPNSIDIGFGSCAIILGAMAGFLLYIDVMYGKETKEMFGIIPGADNCEVNSSDITK